MKDSIGEKQVKVLIMKKFLTVIFTIFGLMVGWIAFMVYSYERSYNEWKSSYTGKIVTNSEKNTLPQVLVRSIMIIKNTLLQVLVRRIMIIKNTLLQVLVRSIMIIQNQMNIQVHMQKLSLCQKNLIYRNRKLNNI